MSSAETGGMRTFFVVWIGQLISVVGSTLTGFGLAIWMYLETDSVTLLALIMLASTLPGILLGPFAGALVDRWDRRKVMLTGDTVAGFATLVVVLLLLTDQLELWQIYLLVMIGSVANSFQEPAYTASVALMVPKRHLGRANGLVQMGSAVGTLVAPALAGVLVATTGLWGVLLVDVATFAVAVATLAVVRISRPAEAPTAGEALWGQVVEGWNWLRARRGLFGFLLVAAGINFLLGFMSVLLIPLILSFSNEVVLGTALSVMGVGMLAGSLVMGIWGGPRRRMRGMLAGIALSGLLVAAMGLDDSVFLVASAAFVLMLIVAIVNGTSQALWQVKVPPEFQGRTFSVRRMLAQMAIPIAYLSAGPLADSVFEPLLAIGGGLAGSVGSVIGIGPGRGIGFMFVVMGLGTFLLAVFAWGNRSIRNLEDELPDMIPDEPVSSVQSPVSSRRPEPEIGNLEPET
ncbi:MAG: MFS transporter [Acidimicrobiia bacterium]|nr:MFS transporter [Acidimicrobiia bacterium]